MLINWMVLMGSHLLIITTSEQRPPLNKDHPNLIAKYLCKRVNHLQEKPPPYKDHFILRLNIFRMYVADHSLNSSYN